MGCRIIQYLYWKIMDCISKEKHPQIKYIKDIAAGAVLIAAIAAFIIGCIIFIPKIILWHDWYFYYERIYLFHRHCTNAWSSLPVSVCCFYWYVLLQQEVTYIFLTWNLFLAYIPYGITLWLTRSIHVIENKKKLLVTLIIWLLFAPNSFYIVTDLFHLAEVDGAPKWFDLLLLFSFAWNALLYGIISIRRVEVILEVINGKRFSLFIIYVVMWLNAFGIYIGRYLRYNTWDVVTNPFSLASEIMHMILHPIQFSYAWGMTICYSIFMMLLYVTIKKMSTIP